MKCAARRNIILGKGSVTVKFGYAFEKFSSARRSLMLPHPLGEARSIASAFDACSLGLHDIRREDLDDNSRDWVTALEELMDTAGIQDPMVRGTWLIKAERLTEEQKFELSRSLMSWLSGSTDAPGKSADASDCKRRLCVPMAAIPKRR